MKIAENIRNFDYIELVNNSNICSWIFCLVVFFLIKVGVIQLIHSVIHIYGETCVFSIRIYIENAILSGLPEGCTLEMYTGCCE